MKLHLPKRLFTALLTAITLAAAPAALTLGSAAWGLSVSYEKSFSTTDATSANTDGEITLVSSEGEITYNFNTGVLTLPGTAGRTTLEFDMAYTWETEENILFIKTNPTTSGGKHMKKILFAASESVPFIKTGGLADVVGSLPKNFNKDEYDVRVILPKYACMKEAFKDKLEFVTKFYIDFNWAARYVGILKTELDGLSKTNY